MGYCGALTHEIQNIAARPATARFTRRSKTCSQPHFTSRYWRAGVLVWSYHPDGGVRLAACIYGYAHSRPASSRQATKTAPEMRFHV